MLVYNGVQVKKEDLDRMDNYVKKICKFSNIPQTVIVNLTEETSSLLRITVSTVYENKKVYATALGTDKVKLMKEASDDIIRQIRKVKTQKDITRETIRSSDLCGEESKTDIPVMAPEKDVTDPKELYKLEYKIKYKSLNVENLSDEGAIDRMESNDLKFFVYYKNGSINIMTKGTNGYVSFEVVD